MKENGGPETAVHMGLVDLIRIELTTSALRKYMINFISYLITST